jgi:histidyl-tRNA synthetase
VRVNNRKILSSLVKYAGVPKSKILQVFRSIDKLDKIGLDGVEKELLKIDLDEEVVKKIMDFISISENEAIDKSKEIVDKKGKEGIDEISKFLEFSEMFGIKDKILVDFSLARGLDYYTSLIFEIWSKDKKIGSLGGGGRYDNLIELFSGIKIPATGISLGIERIFELIKERQKIEKKTSSKIFIATTSSQFIRNAVEIGSLLRNNEISCEFDLMGRNLSKQLEYADKLNIPFVLIIGKKEVESESVKIREMKSGEESIVKIKDIVNWIKSQI